MAIKNFKMEKNLDNIRNFSIIAHIDHGKSTLADRILELTNALSKREMKDQFLDELEIERERGITVKLNTVRLSYNYQGKDWILNLIDTPGHVDFNYEVSRSLQSCEGALLLVDACSGIRSQTLANLYLALEQNLKIIPVINKIDLPNANIDVVKHQIMNLLNCDEEEIILISAKNGTNVDKLIHSIIKNVPAPKAQSNDFKALIFDTYYDTFRGTVLLIRVFQGEVRRGQKVKIYNLNRHFSIQDTYYKMPKEEKCEKISAGEVGLITIKNRNPKLSLLGDTVMDEGNDTLKPFGGYREIKPFVFSSLYSIDSNDFKALQDAILKIHVADSSFTFVRENSRALGYGFRCGFLGTLHMEVIRERLEKEYNLDLIISSPQVVYKILLTNGQTVMLDNAYKFPDRTFIAETLEPIINAKIFVRNEYIGKIMELCHYSRGEYIDSKIFDEDNTILNFYLPLGEIIYSFYDQLKSLSQGYASMEYSIADYKKSDLVKLDILLNGESIDALSFIVHKSKSYQLGRGIAEKLKGSIPRQNFEIPIQATIGSKIIARETIKAVRKNVTAKLYGGDVTRKKKLLEKQKKGKKRMKQVGRVFIPQEALSNVFVIKK